MSKSIQHIAQHLIENLELDPTKVSTDLTSFANTYAFTPRLRHEALILHLNLNRAQDANSITTVKNEMISLVERITKEYEEKKDNEELRKKKDAIQSLNAYFRSQEIKKELVFESNRLGKSFKKNNFSLKDISIQLNTGEITAVVGENGNGKTTLFRLIAGELSPDAGTMNFPKVPRKRGDRLDWFKIKQKIAYVPQDLPVWYGSLRDNIQFEAATHGIKGSENAKEVDYIIHRLGLESYQNLRWSELSGGYKLRFSLAKALVWKPSLLIIDEPLANLDFNVQKIILNDLKDISRSFRFPISILLSSQHLFELELISGKVLFLDKGEVKYYGETSKIGNSRSRNIFELNCKCNIQILRLSLEDIDGIKIYHDGLHFIVNTPLEISEEQIMGKLISLGISVSYFRNISHSIKVLFL